MSNRFEGRSLEEALQTAAETLGVERWQLTYHVLLEKRGFLGGVKRIVIEADVNASAPPPPQPLAPLPSTPYDDAPRRASGGGGGGRDRGRRSGGGGGGRGRGSRGDGRNGGGNRRGGRGGGRSRDDYAFETFIGDVPEQGPESDAARAVREFCENTLVLAKIGMVVRTEENETQINVRLYGGDAKLLTERHGELLDAIQVLANKALVGRNVEKDIELDCEDFKGQRTGDLEQQAREIADRVRRNGREELLPAMTPIERRIVHIALREDEDVTTESRGDGFYKRVAIVLRSEVEQAESAETQPAPEQ